MNKIEELKKELEDKIYLYDVVFKHWDWDWPGMKKIQQEMVDLQVKIKKEEEKMDECYKTLHISGRK